MKNNFQPDFNNILSAARNKEAKRVPLYEHGISHKIIGELTGKQLGMGSGLKGELDEFFTAYNGFFRDFGYDTVTFELCITNILPGGGALGGHVDPVIKTEQDFDRYPFAGIKDIYFETFGKYFEALGRNMPLGMKAIGGVGNGVFEIAQDLTGYENLMLLSYDNPEFYQRIFEKIGFIMSQIWTEFIKRYGETFCVLRFGDDLGYKTNTLLPHADIINYIVPQYAKIVDIVHRSGKPFLLHSCGCIFDVFDEIINKAKIDAKHSNEDVIAPFKVWVDRYGGKIGNFGGIDTDHVCRKNSGIKFLVKDVLDYCATGKGGIAIGTGNSIPDYADASAYLEMINAVRQYRGDFN